MLITPPPVNTHQWGAYKANKQPPEKLDRSFEATKRYAEAAREIGEKEGVPVADVWTAMWKAAREDEREIERFSTDGLHLKADGYQVPFALHSGLRVYSERCRHVFLSDCLR